MSRGAAGKFEARNRKKALLDAADREEEAKRAQSRRSESPRKQGINWIAVGFLLLFTLPAILPALAWIGDKVSESAWGARMGLQRTPLQRLEAFYALHNPEKMHTARETIRKYRGRESLLFDRLEVKYGARP